MPPAAKKTPPFSPEALARIDFLSFIGYVRPDLEIPPHWRLIAYWLERIEAGKERRVIIEIPIRHGKTEQCHRLFPSWYLGRNHTRQVLSATHKDKLAIDCGRSIRNYIGSKLYRRVFPGVSLTQDSKAKGHFHVTKEGAEDGRQGVLTTIGRRGDASGEGADLLVIDDLLGETEAYSEAAKTEAHDMLRALMRRLEPHAAVLIIQSRVAEDDPSGYARAAFPLEGWKVIRLPAVAEEDESHDLGRVDGGRWVRDEGEALWERRWGLAYLQQMQAQLPAYEWSSSYQQRPIPRGNRLVEEDWFRESRYNDEPEDLIRGCHRLVLSVDTSEGVAGGAETALELFAEYPRGSFLVDVVADRFQVPAILDNVRSVCTARRPHIALIEKKSTGVGVIQQLRADTSFKTPIEAIVPPPSLDKITRFAAETPYMKVGKLGLPRKAHPACSRWQSKFEDQLFHFPACTLKDQMDALSQYLSWLRRNPTPSYRSDPGGGTSWLDTLKRASGGYTDEIGVF